MKFLIFSGTTEGRTLAELLSKDGIKADVCVATEYGKEIMPTLPGILVREGRMDVGEMVSLMEDGAYEGVIDATHPYATEVTQNIKEASKMAGMTYHRLLRTISAAPKDTPVFSDDAEVCAYLNQHPGNVFLSVGAKALPIYCEKIDDIKRLYARVLPQEDIVREMAQMGMEKSHMILMQGPFSKELNEAMLRQTNATYLVTKNSGQVGGFEEKIQAAQDCGAISLVIGHEDETGDDLDTLYKKLTGKEPVKKQVVTMLGIGPGSLEFMTQAGVKACESADVIIGARRMLDSLSSFGKETLCEYASDKIVKYIKDHPEKQRFVIAFSGDTGFYSGAKKLHDILKSFSNIQVENLCGISAIQYLASKLKISWEHMKLCSLHGRSMNVISAIQKHEAVYVLLSDASSVQKFAATLMSAGLGKLTMHVGVNLSYPDEVIESRCVRDFFDFSKEGICAAIVENPDAGAPVVTSGMKDEEFIRGEVPMTKEEVRTVCLSKLMLRSDSIVYDIGAGTGSISIEAARLIEQGRVYAIEQKAEGCDLIEQNKDKFHLQNLQVVMGQAPQALLDLEMPTHAFIGGSSGNMKEIIAALLEKNPKIRIVLSGIAMETAKEMMELAEEYEDAKIEIVQITVAKAKELGHYHLMMGQNPIYIMTLAFGEEA
ncbi:MAG: precorrin-6A reductase [Eubacterium sp.]|nr:precorrin-6A reductase [Eubacterium sp.]